MRTILLFAFITCSLFTNSQTTRTTTKEVGKVGKLIFEATTAVTNMDTTMYYSIREKPNLLLPGTIKMVAINPTELKEVSDALMSFVPELNKKKPDNMTTLSYKTKDSLIITCMYQKVTGWSVLMQNTNKEFDDASDKIDRKTGYSLNQFVEIDPFRVEAVAKLLNKIADAKN